MTLINKEVPLALTLRFVRSKVGNPNHQAPSEVHGNWEHQASPEFLQTLQNQHHFTRQPPANQFSEIKTKY